MPQRSISNYDFRIVSVQTWTRSGMNVRELRLSRKNGPAQIQSGSDDVEYQSTRCLPLSETAIHTEFTQVAHDFGYFSSTLGNCIGLCDHCNHFVRMRMQHVSCAACRPHLNCSLRDAQANAYPTIARRLHLIQDVSKAIERVSGFVTSRRTVKWYLTLRKSTGNRVHSAPTLGRNCQIQIVV